MTTVDTQVTAKVICHSKFNDNQLITLETCSPKFIDASLEKHRMISSNSSSDRAIPFSRLKKAEPYLPDDLRYNQSGMQGSDKLSDEHKRLVHETLSELYKTTIKHLEYLEEATNLHKQHLNRYLLGFSSQKKVMTATKEEWVYFLGLRYHMDADPSAFLLAHKIHKAIRESTPDNIDSNEWHLPYVTDEEKSIYESMTLCKVSAARCARTSYDNFDGTKASVDKDLELFNKLVGSNPKHMSPLDHQGLPLLHPKDIGFTHMGMDGDLHSGNFKHWVQFRHYYLQTLKD